MVEVDFSFARATRPASPRRLSQVSDGDTPTIEQPIRMVSCDTPEKSHYAGGPAKSQPKLETCRERLAGSFYKTLPKALRDYLIAKITDDAASDTSTPARAPGRSFKKCSINAWCAPMATDARSP